MSPRQSTYSQDLEWFRNQPGFTICRQDNDWIRVEVGKHSYMIGTWMSMEYGLHEARVNIMAYQRAEELVHQAKITLPGDGSISVGG